MLSGAFVVSWNAWVEGLERASFVPIGSWETFLQALEGRHTAFHEMGCRASDHGLERLPDGPIDEAVAALERALAAGTRLRPQELGLLAALGQERVMVHRRPRVGIISTGDELVSPGEQLEPGKIYDSNASTVAAAVRDNGGEAEFLGVIPDDEAALRAACAKARDGFDAVILSGGTSRATGERESVTSKTRISEFEKPSISN